MPFINLPATTTVFLNFFLWFLIHFTAGFVGAKIPSRFFKQDTGIFRSRNWEQNGQIYQHFVKIKRWKKRLPDCGNAFGQKAEKKKVQSTETPYLEKFILETRRAEWTHWVQMIPVPVFFVFNRWPIGVFMIVYAVATNFPCIMVQRFNRPRLLNILQLKRARINEYPDPQLLPAD